MSHILSYLPSFGIKAGSSRRLDDDVIDRWNHDVTAVLLIILSVAITTQQHFGDPMHCWVPGHFTGNYEKYTDHICWVSNTYKLPLDEFIPRETPEELQLNYYQWVPLFLVIQAMFCYLPCVIWRVFYPNSGVDLNGIITIAQQMTQFEKTTEREKCFHFVVNQTDRYLGYYQADDAICCDSKVKANNLGMGKRRGNFLVIFYILIKTMYLVNAIMQMVILNWFLSTDFHLYGVQIIQSWLTNSDYPATRIFPRSTLCDFHVRAMGNIHRHTVQCVLPINFYNEKVYMVVWFWLVITLFLNTASLLIWSFRLLFPSSSVQFVRHYLKTTKRVQDSNDRDRLVKVVCFVHNYLRQDGVFILRLMKSNVNGLIVAEVLGEMYDNFGLKYKSRDNGVTEV